MSVPEHILLYYALFCVSGAIVCYLRLFIPSWKLVANLTGEEETWFVSFIVSLVFILMCLLIGPGMLFLLKDKDSFIKNYAQRYVDGE